MPTDASSHRYVRGRGGPGFLRQRYSPLPTLQEVPYAKATTTPSKSNTEVRLSGDRPHVYVKAVSGSLAAAGGRLNRTLQGRTNRSPISRPCMRFKNSGSQPFPCTARYSKLAEPNVGPVRSSLGGGGGLLRAVANRGRGYEDLRCRGNGGNLPDSGGSSPASSPRDSPSVSPRGPQSGILITSAIAKSGIKKLSRVSFGSSKGSMVETLIYDSPVAEEERIPEEELLITDPVAQKLGTESAEPQKPASKVRVTFFECEKPLAVTSPEPPEFYGSSLYDLAMSSPVPDAVLPPAYDRQLSSESGRDNPFRPDGDISREADEIVQLIKSGQSLDASTSRPSTAEPPSSVPASSQLPEEVKEVPVSINTSQQQRELQLTTQTDGAVGSPLKTNSSTGANGSTPAPEPTTTSPGPVEVKHVTVTPSEAAQVEHIVLKKKNKCGCCVIQ